MEFNPFVVPIDSSPPPVPSRFRMPHMKPTGVKILIGITSAIMILSMISFSVFSVLTTNKQFSAKHGLDVNDLQIQTEAQKTQAALPGGNVATGTGGTSGSNAPVVTLTADPAGVTLGSTSKLKWSVTNNPKSCEASDDWSGSKSSSGEESTPKLDKVQTYIFTLTCKTDGGTGFATVSVSATAQGGTGDIAKRPVVTFAANPSLVYVGEASTLNWSVANAPDACTASGDWSGDKGSSGSSTTGALSSVKSYTYTLTCKNASGEGYATTTVKTQDLPPDIPVVTLTSSPAGTVLPGSNVTLTWSAINNPTSCTASGDWTGAKSSKGTQQVGPLTDIRTYAYTMTCSNGAGSQFKTASLQVMPNPPVVSLSVSPNSVYKDSSSTITWSSTNTPTSCTASGDWTGAKNASGTMSTGALSTVKTYTYTLTCSNAGGTSAPRSATVAVSLPPKPVVTLSASPISVTTGNSSNLTWSSTNTPTSCTASGDWTGAKNASGTMSTGALSTVKTYTYTLTCSNAGGSGSATTSVSVSSGVVVSKPVVAISLSPTTIGTGGSTTISWSATNNPTSCTASGSWGGAKSASGSQNSGIVTTAGLYTYTLACSNSAGASSASASLTVIAKPTVSVSVSPASITTGSSATITWSVGNGATSCTASGGWTGSKGLTGGSQSTGVMSTANTYIYSLSCSNAGGTTTASATLVVSGPPPVYCSNRTPCYGPSTLNSHTTAGSCWGYNTSTIDSTDKRVYDLTTFNNAYHLVKANLMKSSASVTAICGAKDFARYLAGVQLADVLDRNGLPTRNHTDAAKQNSTSSRMGSYILGYYDPNKP